MYARLINRWERHLSSLDPHRRVTDFAWGWDWLRELPVDGLPAQLPEMATPEGAAALAEWNQRVVAASPEFFACAPVADYRLAADPQGGVPWLRFSSAVRTRYPENNTVAGRWFASPGQRAVVVLPQWNADAGGHMSLCRILQRQGIAALRLSLPYHDVRRPAHLQRAEYTVDPNLGRTIHAARQAVLDIRASLDWLQAQGFSRLGILGTSLGSCYALLTSAHDERLRVNVFNHVSEFFGDVVWTGMATRHVKQGIESHLDRSALRDAWRAISPASYLDRFAALRPEKRNLLIYARYDPCFLPEFSRNVLERFRNLGIHHQVRALACGHYTIGRLPFAAMDGWAMVSFLRREL